MREQQGADRAVDMAVDAHPSLRMNFAATPARFMSRCLAVRYGNAQSST